MTATETPMVDRPDRRRGEVVTTSPRPGEFAEPINYSPADETERYARGVNLANPGRLPSRNVEKPGPDETPWRSKEFVSHRHSADGNQYARGEPVPLEEAVRQNLANPDGTEAGPRMRIPKTTRTCSRCRGTGRARVKNHKPGCKCGLCVQTCATCKGSGFVPRDQED